MNIQDLPLPEPVPIRAFGHWTQGYDDEVIRARDLQVWNMAMEAAMKVCRELDNDENGELYRAAARYCAERVHGLKEQE